MLDLFLIFSKGGIIIFSTLKKTFDDDINKFIRLCILQNENYRFKHDLLTFKYVLDNEFDLIFLAGYQSLLKLTYVDNFLENIKLAFHEKFKDIFRKEKKKSSLYLCKIPVEFENEYKKIYSYCYKNNQNLPQNKMRSYFESEKSKKTVSSIIIKKNGEKINDKPAIIKPEVIKPEVIKSEVKKNDLDQETIPTSLITKRILSSKNSFSPKSKSLKKDEKSKKTTKENRNWGLGKDYNSGDLDFSKKEIINTNTSSVSSSLENNNFDDVKTNLQIQDSSSEDEDDFKEIDSQIKVKSKNLFGNFINTFSYNKPLEKSDLENVLNHLRDHLIAKNVAAEIATNLTDNVYKSLIGQRVNTWIGLKSFVKNALEESILRILSPNRNINILSDIRSKKNLPYVIVFCGVNGVGKSTTLAKISNWLILNDVKVLVVACDTFRAGAIEQLKTHVTALKAIHENDNVKKIDLFEKGYGKDSSAIALNAITYAKQSGYNCCLIDTAGRMQNNEPLMRQLAKLIKVIEPDLTLFVGEALVGNEAVDQLTKFNGSLIDHGCKGVTENSSALNGIVLTKFDTIDDQVGAAVSMTYITGQPIIFVGVGQTYKDLKQLDAKSVVKALMR